MIQLDRVLVPIDFSEFSDQALNYGQELCDKFGAELHLLHVLEVHVTSTPKFALGLAVPEWQEETEDESLQLLNKYPSNWVADREVVRKAAPGSPSVEIARYAKEHEIDVIVIGTHGRTGLPHVLMGSVAENVVRHAPCPVLTVRKEGHHFIEP